MEQIKVDTRTMTPRVIAQELMDACGAYRGMRYPEVTGYCDDHYEVVDFDGEVMSAARWEDALREMLGDRKQRVIVSAWGEESEGMLANGVWEVRPVLFDGTDRDGNPDEWDDAVMWAVEEGLENGASGGEVTVRNTQVAWRVEDV